MAGAMGLEPTTFAVTGRRCNRLNYAPANNQVTEELNDPGGVVNDGLNAPLETREPGYRPNVLKASRLSQTAAPHVERPRA